MRNVALGRFATGDEIIGQITAHRDGRIRIEHARCARLKLLTKDNGTITLKDLDEQGTLERIENGGTITVERGIRRNYESQLSREESFADNNGRGDHRALRIATRVHRTA